MKTHKAESEAYNFLVGGGEMGEKIRAFPWHQNPLGSIEGWPQSLKTSISLMLNSQHPMWIGWGREARFFYNDAYVQVLSLAKHPWALGKPAAEVWAEIWEICGPLADKVFQKGEASFVNDVRLFMSRGTFLEETFYSFSYSPIRDESGNVGGLFCPSAEVTAKVLSTRRLRTLSELAAESMTQKSPGQACAAAARILGKNSDDVPFALIYLTEPDGKFARRAEMINLGHAPDALIPARVDLSGTGRDGCLWPIAEVVETSRGTVAAIEEREGFPPGPAQQSVTEAIVLPLISRDQDRALGVLVAGVNPTRRLDADYRTFFELVASHVGTAIQNARATEQEKKRADTLAELDRAKTTFFGNVSHELRTPLTLILGPIEEELRVSPAPSERLELAHRNSLRLLKLVNTLLDFSRIEAGRLEASFEPVDLAAYTAELASVFRSLFEKAGLRLILNLPPLPEPVYIDRDLWEKMVFNLLSNAFKFTFEGEVEVSLSRSKSTPPNAQQGPWSGEGAPSGEHVCLSVRDTGTGIPAAELPRIFERFHRVRNARSRSHEGTGIGLAFVQELARLHRGFVKVESEEGRGTTFTICIPTGKAHLPEAQVGAPRSLSSTTLGAAAFLEESVRWLPPGTSRDVTPEPDAAALPLQPASLALAPPAKVNGNRPEPSRRILLADDNADMRDYVARLLATRGFRVTAVENGRRALESCRADPPALVLTDVMMPELDGFGLLRELRHDATTSGIPVILLSARAGEEARVEGAEAGADDYLTKPFSARELLARVTTHLELARIRQEGEARLRTSQDRLQRVLDGSSDGYWEWNVSTGEIFMSPRWYEIFGHREGELERHVSIIPGLTHPDDVEMMRKSVRTVISDPAAGDIYEFECRILTKAGEAKWVFVRGKVMRRDDTGHATLVTGAVTDINRRKRMEESLVASEVRYRNLFNCMIEGFCLIEMIFDEHHKPVDFRFLEVNPAFEGQTGLSKVVGKRFREMAEKFDPSWLETYGQVAVNQQPIRFERLSVSINRWLQVFAAPVGPPSLRRVAIVFNDISQRKRAEQELQESEQRMRVANEATGAGIWEWNVLNGRVRWDAQMFRIYGLPPTADGFVEYGDWIKTVFPEDRPGQEKILHDTVLNKTSSQREFRIRRGPDGEIRHIEAVETVRVNRAGEVEWVVGTNVDVTERLRTSEALRRREWELQTITSHAPEIIGRMDRQLRHVFINPAITRATGLSVEQYLGKTNEELGHPPELCAVWSRTYRAVFETGQPQQVDFSFPSPNGTMHFSMRAAPEFAADGTVEYVLFVTTDITDRARVETALRQSEERFRAMSDNIGPLAWMAHPNGEMAWYNKRWYDYFGTSYEKIFGKTTQHFHHPDHWPRVIANYRKAIAEGVMWEDTFPLRGADGIYRWFLSRAYPIRDAEGRITLWFGTNTDVTELRETQIALQAANAQLADKATQLESLVQQRTAKLIETVGDLEAFSYSIAHDMRAPLRSLQGFSDILLEEYGKKIDEEGRGYLKRIAASAVRMDRLIRDVLDYSVVVRADFPLECVELKPLLLDLMETYPMLAPDKADILLLGSFPSVRGNQAMLTQIFSNLMGNAVKFVPADVKPRLRLWAETKGSRIHVFVQDNGIGIAPDEQQKIFGIFQQVDQKYEGTGIGLAIVKKAVERMGGKVGLQSELGKGSTFWVELEPA